MMLLAEGLCVVACSDGASSSGAGSTPDGSTTTLPDGAPIDDGGLLADGSNPTSDAPAGYTPLSIPGIALWLESNTSPSLPATWTDLSANGNDAVLSSGMEAPDRNSSTLNGHAPLVFHGYTSYEIADAPSLQWGTGDFLIEAVCHNNYNESQESAGGTGGTTYYWFDGSYIRYRFGEVVSKVPSGFGPGLSLVFNDWSDRSYKIVGQVEINTAVKAPSKFYLEEPRVLGFRRKGNVLELRSNGAVTATMLDASANQDVSAVGTKLFIGGRPSLTHFVGAFWEIIAVKGTVSDADVTAFEAYAKAKYAL